MSCKDNCPDSGYCHGESKASIQVGNVWYPVGHPRINQYNLYQYPNNAVIMI